MSSVVSLFTDGRSVATTIVIQPNLKDDADEKDFDGPDSRIVRRGL